MQERIQILLEILPHLWVLFWENLAPVMGHNFGSFDTHTHLKIGKLPPPPLRQRRCELPR